MSADARPDLPTAGVGARHKGHRSRGDAAAEPLPGFCRQRHLAKSRAYVLPLWELPTSTASWLPDELVESSVASAEHGADTSDGIVAQVCEAEAVVTHLLDQPGMYSILHSCAVTPTVRCAADLVFETIDPGMEVDVVEVVKSKAEGRMRGRISEPAGWISLAAIGDDRRWATRVRGLDEAVEDGVRESDSESDQSEVEWDGPLGQDHRRWSCGMLDNARVLFRKMPAPAGSADSDYGLALSAALFSGRQQSASDAALDRRLMEVLALREPRWAVVALRSGHFAGAVFQGPNAIVHKTIHRYTCRAKQGGSQSAHDSASGKAKSAGASLRRYGEQRLAEEIREIMKERWAKQLSDCEVVFISVSKRCMATLVGTQKEPYVPRSKVRRLPFMLGRPTFASVKEAYFRCASVAFAELGVMERSTRPIPKADITKTESDEGLEPLREMWPVAATRFGGS